ncbi:MAG: sortase [Solirubrobacterales bacterium]
MKRAGRILSVALITAGVVILIDAAITLAWQEPLSAIYANVRQAKAQDQLDAAEQRFSSDPSVARAKATRDPAKRADQLASIYAKQISNGQGIGQIAVPSVGIDYVLIQGTDTADLQKGPGHYPTSALPGQGKTIAVAGHRTTYLAPFRDIADIKTGDEVTVSMPYGKFTYEVIATDIVDPQDVSVVDDAGRERIVLTACHPLYSAAQRYVVTAKLTDIELKP